MWIFFFFFFFFFCWESLFFIGHWFVIVVVLIGTVPEESGVGGRSGNCRDWIVPLGSKYAPLSLFSSAAVHSSRSISNSSSATLLYMLPLEILPLVLARRSFRLIVTWPSTGMGLSMQVRLLLLCFLRRYPMMTMTTMRQRTMTSAASAPTIIPM